MNSRNHFLRLVLASLGLALALSATAFAQDSPTIGKDTVVVSIKGVHYRVGADGVVIDVQGNAVQNKELATKAQYTASVVRERISHSKYNKVVFAPVTRTMIELQSLVKPVSGAYAYVLLSSGRMAFSLVEGGLAGGPAGAFGNVAKDVGKDAILEVTKQIVEHPEKTAMKMADDAYALGLRAYRDNYRTYHSVLEKGHVLSYDEALDYMANEKQKELLGVATKLIRDIRSKKYKVGQYDGDSETIRQAKQKLLTKIAHMKGDQLSKKVELAFFMTKFKPILEEALAGMDGYKPYTDFQETVSSLNDAFAKIEQSYRNNQTVSEFDTEENASERWRSDRVQPPAEEPAYARPWLPEVGEQGVKVTSEYVATTKESAERILREYKSVPGGVTLEGQGVGLEGLKSVRFEQSVSAFVFDKKSAYVLPVTRQEMRDILLAISKNDKMGVSMAGEYIVYGGLDKANDIT